MIKINSRESFEDLLDRLEDYQQVASAYLLEPDEISLLLGGIQYLLDESDSWMKEVITVDLKKSEVL